MGSSSSPEGCTAWVCTLAHGGPESADSGGSGHRLLLQLQTVVSLPSAWPLTGTRGWTVDHTGACCLPGCSKPTRDLERRPCSGLGNTDERSWSLPSERLAAVNGQVKVKVKLLSRVRLFAISWTVAHQAPPSMEFSRQEYWSGVPFPSPELGKETLVIQCD